MRKTTQNKRKKRQKSISSMVSRPQKRISTPRRTKKITIKLTKKQWDEVVNWAQKARLETSIYVRHILLDFLNIKD